MSSSGTARIADAAIGLLHKLAKRLGYDLT